MGQRDWDAFVERARAVPILEAAERLGAKLKKAGAEHIGPCPLCGGRDRFAVNPLKRIFVCRGSEGAGDNIAMVQHVNGFSFVESCEFLTREERPDRTRDETEAERNSRQWVNAQRAQELKARMEAEARAHAHEIKRNEAHVGHVIDTSKPIEGTHAEAYLRQRGLRPSRKLTSDLRFVEALDYWGMADNGLGALVKLGELPALIAIIRDYGGAVIGIAETFLHPKKPEKYPNPKKGENLGSPRNSAKKIRGEKKHGMVRLGPTGPTLAIAEGWENALAWHQLGLGPEDVTLAAAVDLGNMCGGATGWVPHKTAVDVDGRPRRIANGVPDKAHPGVIIPDDVRSLILIGDADSDYCATTARMVTAVRRFLTAGYHVDLTWPREGTDFNDMLLAEAAAAPIKLGMSA